MKKMHQRFELIGLTTIGLGLTCSCGGADAGDLFDRSAMTPDQELGPAVDTGSPSPETQAPPIAGSADSPAPPAAAGMSGSGGVAQEAPVPAAAPVDPGAPLGEPGAGTPSDEATGPAPLPCVLGEFGAPVKLAGLGLDEPLWGPAPSLMDTGLFFTAGSDPERLFFAERSDVGSAQFSAASPIVELASDGFDGTPFASASGLRLYFYSTREGSSAGSRDLWFAERPSVADPFGPAVPLTELNSSSGDLLPRLSADELSIVFTSQRPEGKGRTDIWRARRDAVGAAFGVPENVAELNTELDDTGAWLSSDGLTVFFASNRAGGQGGLDFWRAARARTDAPFGPAEVMAELNTPGEELDIAFSSTERELFFSSDRDGAVELWRAVRECQ